MIYRTECEFLSIKGNLQRSRLALFQSFLQKYFIPTSLIAGILGLLLGPQVLGQVSPVCIQFSDSISQWVNFFFAFIFATSFLGSKSTKFGRNVISATCVTGAVFMAQVVVGLALAYGFSMVMDNVFCPVSLTVCFFIPTKEKMSSWLGASGTEMANFPSVSAATPVVVPAT